MAIPATTTYTSLIRQRWHPVDATPKAHEQQHNKHIVMKSLQIIGGWKHTNLIILALAATLTIGCDKQKTAIENTKDATKEAIDIRKDEVNTAAKKATAQTDANAKIDKAQIEANKDSIQAQLDADKKKADAEAAAAKAKVDAENK